MTTPSTTAEATSFQAPLRGTLLVLFTAVGGLFAATAGLMFQASAVVGDAARERFRFELTADSTRVGAALRGAVADLEVLAGKPGLEWVEGKPGVVGEPGSPLAAAVRGVVHGSSCIRRVDYVTDAGVVAFSSEGNRGTGEPSPSTEIAPPLDSSDRCAIRCVQGAVFITVPVRSDTGSHGILRAELSGAALLARGGGGWCALLDASGQLVGERGEAPDALLGTEAWRTGEHEVDGMFVASAAVDAGRNLSADPLRVTTARTALDVMGPSQAMKSRMAWLGAGAALTLLLGIFALLRFAGASESRLADLDHELEEQGVELYRTHNAFTEESERARAAGKATIALLDTLIRELRAPLNGILGLTDLLLETDFDAGQSELARAVQSSARSLAALPGRIVDFTKTDTGSLYFEHVDANLLELVEDAIELVAQSAEAKGLEICTTLRACVPIHVRCDPGRVRRILVSALASSIENTRGGEVTLHAYVEGDEGSRAFVRFEVCDTGAGGPEKRLAELGGIQTLVEHLGGQMQVDDGIGVGSVVWFVLPFERMPQRDEAGADAPGALAGLRVLLVEDGAGVRGMLEHWLGEWGCVVQAIDSAHMALQLLADPSVNGRTYDVALVDFELEQGGGARVMRRVRKSRRLGSLPLVAMTTLARRAALERSSSGAARVLTKPLRRSHVLAMLANLAMTARKSAPSAPGHQEARRAQDPTPNTSLYAPVLIAEDNEANQRLADKIVRKLGFGTVIVPDGARAVEAAREGRFSVVLMDVMMPGMDGIEATQRIRELERGTDRHLPILTLTANAMDDDKERCLSAGADAHIPKPVDRKQLEAEILRWAEWSYQREATRRAAVAKDPALDDVAAPLPAPEEPAPPAKAENTRGSARPGRRGE